MSGSEERDSLNLSYREEEEQEHEVKGEQPESSAGLRKAAEVVSVILHPLFIPSILFGIVLFFSPHVSAPLSEEYRFPVWGLLVVTTLVIPLSSFLILHYFGTMPSLKMARRQERPVPFLYISFFYAVTTYFFVSKFPSLINLNIMLAGITFILFVITLITFYWKISAHSTGIGGAVGFLAAFSMLYHDLQLMYPLAVMVVLAGISMSARLYLNEHKPLEVWVGALLGLSMSFASVLVLFLF